MLTLKNNREVNRVCAASSGSICLCTRSRTEESFWSQLREGQCPCSEQSLVLVDFKVSMHFKCCIKYGSFCATYLTQTLLITIAVGFGLATCLMMQEVYFSDLKYISEIQT